MADNKSTGKKKRGLFHYINATLAALFGSLILSIIFEWLGIAFLWPEQGHLHSQKMMLTELEWLSDNLTRGLFYHSPKELAEAIILSLHEWLFINTGVKDWLANPREHSGVGLWVYHYGRAYIESVIYVTAENLVRDGNQAFSTIMLDV